MLFYFLVPNGNFWSVVNIHAIFNIHILRKQFHILGEKYLPLRSSSRYVLQTRKRNLIYSVVLFCLLLLLFFYYCTHLKFLRLSFANAVHRIFNSVVNT